MGYLAPMRWGIAGTGNIAGSMTTALAGLDDAQVVAVGSRSAESAATFAARHGIGRSYGSYQELFDDDEVDIVYVASPHSLHHDMTIAALEAGRHVLCEKAFALNAAEARRMVDTARRCERFLMEAMWMWFIPAVVDIKARVDMGEIGDVKVVEADFGLPIADENGRHRRLDLAGGALLDLGIYPISFARHLAGEPVEVKALGHLGPSGVDTTLGGVMSFASGAVGVFHTSLDAMSTLRATVVGTLGRIEVDAPFWYTSGFTVALTGEQPVHVTVPNQGLAHEAAHVIKRIRDGHLESDVIPLATTVSMMELLDEIRSQVGVVYPGER
jgi:predicted dehydrogenase